MGSLHLKDAVEWAVEDYRVSKEMQSYFAKFIHTGNLNGEGLPDWPAAKSDDPCPHVMIIDTVSKAEEADIDDRYRFLDEFYENNQVP